MQGTVVVCDFGLNCSRVDGASCSKVAILFKSQLSFSLSFMERLGRISIDRSIHPSLVISLISWYCRHYY